MTLTRILLVSLSILGSLVACLSFFPPQTGKWFYMWQAYWSPFAEEGMAFSISGAIPRSKFDNFKQNLILLTFQPPHDHDGPWKFWSREGELIGEMNYQHGKVSGFCYEYDGSENLNRIYDVGADNAIEVVFDIDDKIDRRAEFGIPVE